MTGNLSDKLSVKGWLTFAGKLAALSCGLVMTACSSLPGHQYQDPYEAWNRRVYNFNDSLDRTIVRPATEVYVAVTPDPVERGVSNFFSNLAHPAVAVSQLLQFKVGESLESTLRFGVNSTIGVAGIFDVATGMGLGAEQEDIGQTLATWGVGSGPYVVLPLVGGMTVRDGFGRVTAMYVNPSFYLEDDEARTALGVSSAVNTSAQLLDERDLIKGDGYLFVRDAYLQRRQFLIADGAVTEDDPFLDD